MTRGTTYTTTVSRTDMAPEDTLSFTVGYSVSITCSVTDSDSWHVGPGVAGWTQHGPYTRHDGVYQHEEDSNATYDCWSMNDYATAYTKKSLATSFRFLQTN